MPRLGCSSRSSFSGNSPISCPSRGCIAKTTSAQVTSSCPRARSKTALLPGCACCPPWVSSRSPLFPHFAVTQESSTLPGLSFWEASFSTTAYASPCKGPLPARGSYSLLQFSTSLCCLPCSRWTKSDFEKEESSAILPFLTRTLLAQAALGVLNVSLLAPAWL